MPDPSPTPPPPKSDPENTREEEQNVDRDGRERMPTDQKPNPQQQPSQ